MRCDRKGRYAKARPIERFGADAKALAALTGIATSHPLWVTRISDQSKKCGTGDPMSMDPQYVYII
jgi:hypothetical protein